MKNLSIIQIPVLKDNYIYIIRTEGSQDCAVVDPAEAEPVLIYAKAHNLRVAMILNTHHHADHTGGNLRIQKEFSSSVYASAYDRERIPGQTHQLREGDTLSFGANPIQIIATPGHTLGHIVYYLPTVQALFCGDTLFSMGCGRLFEGTPEDMWSSLLRLRELPSSTQVYCTHEYTLHNAAFVTSLNWPAEGLEAYIASKHALRQQDRSTVPMLLGDERLWNPFLRVDDPTLAQALGQENARAVDVFRTLRLKRDEF